MSKVGIITLSASDNCGSLLQTYALMSVLKKNNCDVEIINYINKASKKMYRIIHPSYIKKPRKFFGTFLMYFKIKKQKKEYELFRQNNLKLTEEIYSDIKKLKQIEKRYDSIVCGSDQIWNTKMYDYDEVYLLDWVEAAKKYSYAASLGDQKDGINIQNLKAYRDLFKTYNAISVRETSSAKNLQKAMGLDIGICLDPTLLLDKNEWNNLIKDRKKVDEKFIFYYSYNYADEIINKMVSDYAKQVNMKVYVINASRWVDGSNKKYGFDIFNESGPLAFLHLMRDADTSMVESFHGTVFSYIYDKNFWFMKNQDDKKLDDRINDIMEILNIKDRVLSPSDIKGKKINEKYIPKISDSQFEEFKNMSLEFIDRIAKEV